LGGQRARYRIKVSCRGILYLGSMTWVSSVLLVQMSTSLVLFSSVPLYLFSPRWCAGIRIPSMAQRLLAHVQQQQTTYHVYPNRTYTTTLASCRWKLDFDDTYLLFSLATTPECPCSFLYFLKLSVSISIPLANTSGRSSVHDGNRVCNRTWDGFVISKSPRRCYQRLL